MAGRGSKPGERRGGRKPGTPNKSTGDVKAMALPYTAAAMVELARLSVGAQSEQARVMAIKELFDRAFGKSTQLLDAGGALADLATELAAAKRRVAGDGA